MLRYTIILVCAPVLGAASCGPGETRTVDNNELGGSAATVGGGSARGGAGSGGSASVQGGATAQGGSTTATGGQAATSRCDAANLTWRSANKTNYTSYPDPGSEECVKYNGCTWAGQFAACDGVKPEAWVAAHDIVAAFPDFASLELHELCLRKGDKKIVVTVLDTCGDSDCDGCCTQNQGSAAQLIDIESYTDARWGVADGPIEWADLGRAAGDPCQ
ncbi:MAG: hypothetical protein QM756_14140 [Polyangiaceae bacterium]